MGWFQNTTRRCGAPALAHHQLVLIAFVVVVVIAAAVTSPALCHARTVPAPVLLEVEEDSFLAQDQQEPELFDAATGERIRRDDAPLKYQATIPFHQQLLIHWTGEGSKVIFAVGSNRNSQRSYLYRSTDYGKTFQDESRKLGENPHVSTFQPSPHDAQHIVVVDTVNNAVYITTDGGESFPPHHPGFKLMRVSFNPTVDGMLWGDEAKVSQADGETHHHLRVSVDRGQTWSGPLTDASQHDCSLDTAVWSQSGWSEQDNNDTLYVACRTKRSLQLLHIASVTEAHQTGDKSVLRGEDITPTHIAEDFVRGSFRVIHEYMFVASEEKDTDGSSHDVHRTLYISTDRGPFQSAILPSDVGHVLDFEILDASEDQVFLSVLHTNTCNVYISPRDGREFVLSLSNVVKRTGKGQDIAAVDFQRIDALRGVYVANKLLDDGSDVVTYITYDKGAEWERIRPPPDTYSGDNGGAGSASVCELPDCSLHLGMSALAINKRYQFDLLYSTPSAPGLILGNGNTGSVLTIAPAGYHSADAGVTWDKVPGGLPREFVSVDHGGVLVATPPFDNKAHPVSTLLFSVDLGNTWEELSFTKTPITVVRVLTEPGETSTVVSVWGYDGQHFSSDSTWHIVSVDFSAILGRKCTDDDYTTWSPRDLASPVGCLLGERETFERRKADSKCLNGRNYDRPVARETCECYADDYECDEGFERVEDDTNVCLPIGDTAATIPACKQRGQIVHVSRGYRKVSGDKCEGGLETMFAPVAYTCPDPCPMSEWSEWSPCNLCFDRISKRTRQLLNPDQARDYCGATVEMRECELSSFDGVVSVFPEELHVRTHDSVILSALLDNVSVPCNNGGSATPDLKLNWELLDAEGNSAEGKYAAYDDALPFARNTDVLENLKFTKPGIYKARITVSNGRKSDQDEVVVVVHRASGSVEASWHATTAIGKHASHYKALVEQTATEALRETLGLSVRTLHVEDVRVLGHEARVLGKVYYIGEKANSTEYFKRLDTTLASAARSGNPQLTLELPGPHTLSVVKGSTSVIRSRDPDESGDDDDWWFSSTTANTTTGSTTTGRASKEESTSGSPNAGLIAVPVILVVLAAAGGVIYWRQRRGSGRIGHFNNVQYHEVHNEDVMDSGEDDEMIQPQLHQRDDNEILAGSDNPAFASNVDYETASATHETVDEE